MLYQFHSISLRWRHNGRDGVSNHQPHDCLLNRLFGRRSKKTSKPRVTGPCAGNSMGTSEFSTQMASNAETVSIWWRHDHLISSNWAASSHSLFRLKKRKNIEVPHYLMFPRRASNVESVSHHGIIMFIHCLREFLTFTTVPELIIWLHINFFLFNIYSLLWLQLFTDFMFECWVL